MAGFEGDVELGLLAALHGEVLLHGLMAGPHHGEVVRARTDREATPLEGEVGAGADELAVEIDGGIVRLHREAQMAPRAGLDVTRDVPVTVGLAVLADAVVPILLRVLVRLLAVDLIAAVLLVRQPRGAPLVGLRDEVLGAGRRALLHVIVDVDHVAGVDGDLAGYGLEAVQIEGDVIGAARKTGVWPGERSGPGAPMGPPPL